MTSGERVSHHHDEESIPEADVDAAFQEEKRLMLLVTPKILIDLISTDGMSDYERELINSAILELKSDYGDLASQDSSAPAILRPLRLAQYVDYEGRVKPYVTVIRLLSDIPQTLDHQPEEFVGYGAKVADGMRVLTRGDGESVSEHMHRINIHHRQFPHIRLEQTQARIIIHRALDPITSARHTPIIRERCIQIVSELDAYATALPQLFGNRPSLMHATTEKAIAFGKQAWQRVL